MNLHLIRALAWKEAQMLRQDKRFIIFLFLVPTILALLLYKGIGATGHSNGADQAVPGFSVMFGFYIITYIGVSHYREHAWGAWTMVRAAGIPRLTAAIGVLAPYYLLGVAQLTIMLLVGGVALGAHMRGSPIMVFCLILATEATIVGIAVTLLNVTSSLTAMQQTTQMIVLVLGAIGGALLPLRTMPQWSQAVAHFTPQFWSIQGIQGVMAKGQGLSQVWPNLAVLLGMGALLIAVGVGTFDAQKVRRVPLR